MQIFVNFSTENFKFIIVCGIIKIITMNYKYYVFVNDVAEVTAVLSLVLTIAKSAKTRQSAKIPIKILFN